MEVRQWMKLVLSEYAKLESKSEKVMVQHAKMNINAYKWNTNV